MRAGRGTAAAFRHRYGASPLHLLLVLASFALAVYAGIRLLAGDTLGVIIWFVGAAMVHDLILLPLYSVTDRAAQRLFRGGRDAGRPLTGRASTTCACRRSSPPSCCWCGGR